MPNFTDVSINLTGEERNIKEFYEEIIENKDNDTLEFTDGSMCEVIINFSSNEIYIDGEGIWEGPYETIIDLVEKYKLSGLYFEIDCCSSFSHLIEFKNGEIINEEEDKYYSELSMRVKGLDYWLTLESSICEEEDWEEEYEEIIEFFQKFGGLSLEELKNELLQ